MATWWRWRCTVDMELRLQLRLQSRLLFFRPPALRFPSGLPSHPVKLDAMALAKKLSDQSWELRYCPPEAGISFVLQQTQFTVLLLVKKKKKIVSTTLLMLLKSMLSQFEM